jgi:hypothetical protein
MANKHEAHETGTKSAVLAQSEPSTPGSMRAQAGLARISGQGSYRKLGTVG